MSFYFLTSSQGIKLWNEWCNRASSYKGETKFWYAVTYWCRGKYYKSIVNILMMENHVWISWFPLLWISKINIMIGVELLYLFFRLLNSLEKHMIVWKLFWKRFVEYYCIYIYIFYVKGATFCFHWDIEMKLQNVWRIRNIMWHKGKTQDCW